MKESGQMSDGVRVPCSLARPNASVHVCRYMIQYGKHALDMIASSQDSLRLTWLGQMFMSAMVVEGRTEEDEGISVRSAVGLIRRGNPGVRSSKVEHRFRELQRVRAGRDGAGEEGSDGREVEDCRRGWGKEQRVTKQEFIEVFHDLCTRPEIYFLLVQFSSNKEYLDTKDLMTFLEAEQGVAQVSVSLSLALFRTRANTFHFCRRFPKCYPLSRHSG